MRTMGVRANADTPERGESETTGLGGIGLCRTERMFNPSIVFPSSGDDPGEYEGKETGRDEKLLPMQRSDFKEIFRAWKVCR